MDCLSIYVYKHMTWTFIFIFSSQAVLGSTQTYLIYY